MLRRPVRSRSPGSGPTWLGSVRLRGWVIVALLLAGSLLARRRWPLAVITAVIGAAAAAALVLVVIHLADRSLLASVRGGRPTVTTKDDKEQP